MNTVVERPRVLLIVGSGRSGSTLLERALGGVPGVAALGEVVHLWERAVRDDELCACGDPFHSCPFWAGVGKRAFGDWGRVGADSLIDARHSVVRTRRIPQLVTSSPSSAWRSQRDRLRAGYIDVLRAAQEESGSRLLVDSSKIPAYAALLMRGDIDLCCLEVVRDPRGVANSLRKSVVRPEAAGESLMYRTGVAKSALWWSAFDALTTGLDVVGRVPFTSVRYEDFVADPRGTLGRVLDFARVTHADSDLDHVSGDRILLGPNHQVAGNPVRFRTGEVEVRRDEAWRDQLTAREQRTVLALTAGLRHRYGYR